jgi:anaerobic magnesium-protoporphyrin IX monomethyl ester cyclase
MSTSPLTGVTLIYPYFRSKDPVEKLFPPLGIAYLASQLKEMRIPVTVEDCTFSTFEEVIDRITRSHPAIVGISIMVTMSRNASDLLRELREQLPGTLFVAGGPLPTVNPAMFAGTFDGVFCGEGDVTFPRFCQDYLSSCSSPDDLKTWDPAYYPGLYLNIHGQVRSSPPIHPPQKSLTGCPSRTARDLITSSIMPLWKKRWSQADPPDRYPRLPGFLRRNEVGIEIRR